MPLRPCGESSVGLADSPACLGSVSVDRAQKRGLLRERTEGTTEVRPVELFFDLVYVLAVTQLTRRLLDHLSLLSAGQDGRAAAGGLGGVDQHQLVHELFRP